MLIVQLRAKGLIYDEIAEQAGYANSSSCRKAIARELDRVIVTNVDEPRNVECYHLDKLLAAVIPDDSAKKPDLYVTNCVRTIIDGT